MTEEPRPDLVEREIGVWMGRCWLLLIGDMGVTSQRSDPVAASNSLACVLLHNSRYGASLIVFYRRLEESLKGWVFRVSPSNVRVVSKQLVLHKGLIYPDAAGHSSRLPSSTQHRLICPELLIHFSTRSPSRPTSSATEHKSPLTRLSKAQTPPPLLISAPRRL